MDSDLEFAAPRDADLPDEGRAYVENVTVARDNSGFAARAIRGLSNLLGTCYGASVGGTYTSLLRVLGSDTEM